jgi:hypothetical protein
LNDSAGFAGQVEVVGDENECGAGGGVEVKKEVDDSVAGFVIEIAGGFVGEKNFGTVEEGPGESDALLFPTGELRRVMMKALGEADFFQEAGGDVANAAFTAQFEGNHYILDGGESGEKLEILENETDRFTAEACSIIFVQRTEIATIEQHGT